MNDPIVESPFLKEVRSAFDVLLRGGALTIGSSLFDAEAFGNAQVVLAGRNFQVRLVRDRGDVFADVCSSTSTEWRPLERTLRAVGVVGAPAEGLRSVGQVAKLIEEQISALESGFAPGSLVDTHRALRRLDADAVKRVEERWRTGDKNEN
jgi:hypothetical protein